MRWWRRLVIPVVVLAVVIVSSTRVISSHDAGLVHFTWCSNEQLSIDEPSADLLILGSSRSGMGVDPPWIEEQLIESYPTVERITFLANGEMIKNLGLRTYLRERGVPRTLVLELGFQQKSSFLAAFHGPPAEPFEIRADLQLTMGPRAYADLVSDLVSHGGISLGDVFLRSTVVSPARFMADRLERGAAVALRRPDSVIEPETAECGESMTAGGMQWTSGTSRPYQPRRIKEPDPGGVKILEERAKTFGGVGFDDPFTQDEVTFTRDIIRTAREAGVENVILLYLPTYGKAGAAVDVDQIRTLFPDEPIIDGYRVMHDPSKPLLKYQYRDVTHVNRIGARAISQAIVDAVNALDLD